MQKGLTDIPEMIEHKVNRVQEVEVLDMVEVPVEVLDTGEVPVEVLDMVEVPVEVLDTGEVLGLTEVQTVTDA